MDEVEVKIAVTNEALSPVSVANGSMSRPEPRRMPMPKAPTMSCVGCRQPSQPVTPANMRA